MSSMNFFSPSVQAAHSRSPQARFVVLSEERGFGRLEKFGIFLVTDGCSIYLPTDKRVELPLAHLENCRVESVFDVQVSGEELEEYLLVMSFGSGQVDRLMSFRILLFFEEKFPCEQVVVEVTPTPLVGVKSVCRFYRMGRYFFSEGLPEVSSGKQPKNSDLPQLNHIHSGALSCDCKEMDDGIQSVDLELEVDLTRGEPRHRTEGEEEVDFRIEKILRSELGNDESTETLEKLSAEHEHHLQIVLTKIGAISKRKILHVIEASDLVPFFDVPRDLLARRLGICVTLLKKICRKNGIKSWPYRKLLPIERKIVEKRRNRPELQTRATDQAVRDMIEYEIDQLNTRKKEIMDTVFEDRSSNTR